MPTLLYIHGFLSSPASGKAIQMRDWLEQNRPKTDYLCPFLSPYFDETKATLNKLVEERLPEPVYLIPAAVEFLERAG